MTDEMEPKLDQQTFVRWFRNSAPYINAFRGRTFVLAFGGEVLAEEQFAGMVHDIALLNSLGVRLVLVHGARPQIEQRLTERKVEMQYENDLRVTDAAALTCVKDAVGSVRVEIEALLSMGVTNSPMAGADIRVASGNYVTAQPLGVRDGTDYQHTGEVRRIDAEAIHRHLDNGSVVLLSPLGYSPTGETFNLSAEDVATSAAIALKADKLITFIDGPGLTTEDGSLIRQIDLKQAQSLLQKPHHDKRLGKTFERTVFACSHGVRRAHMLDRHIDGALLIELFSRDGIGTLISSDTFEDLRQANIDDVGGVLELIGPMEQEGTLVRREREKLEMEIEHFIVVERDGMVIACSALYPFVDDQCGELACLAVHPDYRKQGRGDDLLEYIELKAKGMGIKNLFVLTTRAAHWFQERGFKEASIEKLPVAKQQMYNYKRRSKVFIKSI